MRYLVVAEGFIANIIESDEAFAVIVEAVPDYVGANIGAEYNPPMPVTTEEAILDKLTEIEYRQDLRDLGLTEGGAGV